MERLTSLFPLWVLAGALVGVVHPPLVTWFSGQAIVWGLAVIMLGMGVTLDADDFRGVLATPWPIAFGVAAQYTVMPTLGWGIAHALGLAPPLAVGLILVACCPGGTASNVVSYLARANVPLSVLMTTCSTFGAVAATPLLTEALAGTYVPVDAAGLFWSTVQVVLVPVLLGVLLNRWAPALVRVVLPVAPLVSVLAIALICASIIGQSREAVLHAAPQLMAAVTLLHAGGFALGYLLTHLAGYDVASKRTVSIEVGMQNSGLGVVLARQHFADPLTALPCALSATMHSIIGSVLAARWRRRARP